MWISIDGKEILVLCVSKCLKLTTVKNVSYEK